MSEKSASEHTAELLNNKITASKTGTVKQVAKDTPDQVEPLAGENTEQPAAPEKAPEVKAPEQKPAPAKGTAERRISVFDDMALPTEEDAGQQNRMENAVNALSDTVDDMPTEEEALAAGDNDLRVKKELAKINAMVIVELMDVLFMFLCLWCSGDWSEDAQKKYTLVPTRKKAIQIPLYQLLMRRKKATNPVAAIIFLVLGSYAPMIILAILKGIKTKREKQKESEEVAELQRQLANAQTQTQSLQTQLQNASAQHAFNQANLQYASAPVQNRQPVPPAPYNALQVVKPAAKGKARGRHLHWCESKRGGVCNCAGYVHKPKCPANHGKKCTCYNK